LALANELRLGNVSFIEEKISGKVSWKQRKISEIVESANEGDNLIVAEISRLGRSLLEIVEILSICSRRRLTYSVSKELGGLIQPCNQNNRNGVCAVRWNRTLSYFTTHHRGVENKKTQWRYFRRPKGKIGKSKLDQFKPEIEGLLANGTTQKFIADRYKTTEANCLCGWKNIKLRGLSLHFLKEEIRLNVDIVWYNSSYNLMLPKPTVR